MTEEFDDIFEGYENDLQKAVALVEWQKSQIERLTVNMNAFGLAAKRLAEEKTDIEHTLSDLKKEIHDKAVYSKTQGINPYISIRTFDAILNNVLKKHTEG